MPAKKILKTRAAATKFTFKYEGAGPAKGVVGRYYPADDVVAKKGPVPVRNPPKLKAGLVPGQVVILLAGRFAGKRVVFLKQLKSGLLLVSGPYNVNGVPLKRVNQRYVNATSTTVSLAGVNVASIDDELFKRESKEKKVAEQAAARKAAQKAVDDALKASVAKTDHLEGYLKSLFSLKKGDKPHAMEF